MIDRKNFKRWVCSVVFFFYFLRRSELLFFSYAGACNRIFVREKSKCLSRGERALAKGDEYMQKSMQTRGERGQLTVRHVLVVVTGILVCFGPATLVFNTWSILVVPVCESLHVPTGSFTLYVSVIFLASAIAAPFAGNLMERYDVRVVITAACGLCATGIFLCSFYTEVWQFYVSGALEGIGWWCWSALLPRRLSIVGISSIRGFSSAFALP